MVLYGEGLGRTRSRAIVISMFINPRRACAARVTVLGLCLSVCRSVCLSDPSFSSTARNKAATFAILTGSGLHWLHLKKGDFRKITAFKSYGVEQANMQISTGLLASVETSEVGEYRVTL